MNYFIRTMTLVVFFNTLPGKYVLKSDSERHCRHDSIRSQDRRHADWEIPIPIMNREPEK